MEVKSQRIFALSFIAFLLIVVIVSFAFEYVLPRYRSPEGTTGGYAYGFIVECVDENGNLLKKENMNAGGTLWSLQAPAIEGYVPDLQSISREDITNWRYPASHYVREANGSITIVYSPIG